LSVQIAVLSLIRRTIKAGLRGVQFIILMGGIRGCDTDESHLFLKIQRQVRGREARKSPIKIPRSGSTRSSVKRKAKEEEIKGYENADGYSDMDSKTTARTIKTKTKRINRKTASLS